MSGIAYGLMTGLRQKAQPKRSESVEPPSMKTYVDALAALVPAEVLTAHAVILNIATEKRGEVDVHIAHRGVLAAGFVTLMAFGAAAFWYGKRLSGQPWARGDGWRVLIPPMAFVGWCLAQKPTAFDGVYPACPDHWRSFSAVVLAVVLAAAATLLAKQADEAEPGGDGGAR